MDTRQMPEPDSSTGDQYNESIYSTPSHIYYSNPTYSDPTNQNRALRSSSIPSSCDSTCASTEPPHGTFRQPAKRKRKDSRLARQAKRLRQSEEEQIQQRSQANDRERERTQSLNDAFIDLRRIIPTMPSDKMSKIQTLKLASHYIDFLSQAAKTDKYDTYLTDPTIDSLSERMSRAFNSFRMQVGANNHFWPLMSSSEGVMFQRSQQQQINEFSAPSWHRI